MNTGRYSLFARALHWISAVMVLGVYIGGAWLGFFEPADGPFKDALYNLHESFGVTLWSITLIRLLSRVATGVPAMPNATPALVRIASTLNHGALYAVLLAQPVVGFMGNNAGGYPLSWFNLVNLPNPIGKNDALSDQLFKLHGTLGWALVILVTMHLLGSAYHGWVKKDGIVSRMA
jgi:cytochrome b561